MAGWRALPVPRAIAWKKNSTRKQRRHRSSAGANYWPARRPCCSARPRCRRGRSSASCPGRRMREILLLPPSRDPGCSSTVLKALRWKPLPIASFRPIRRRRAARMPAAPSSSIASSRDPMADSEGLYVSRRSKPARRARARSPRPVRPQMYRAALAALDEACRAKYAGKAFAELAHRRPGHGAQGTRER